jgi:hypothetical protein
MGEFPWHKKTKTIKERIDGLIEFNMDLQAHLEVLLNSKVYYALPSDLHEHIEDARGIAVLRAARSGKKKHIEKPVEVKV